MNVAILTTEQKDLIDGYEMRPFNFVNVIQDINDNFVIDEITINILNIEWLDDLPLVNFNPKTLEI